MVLAEDGHAPPALLAPLLLLHHVVRAEALDALALHRDARVGHQQGGVEPKVEVGTVPGVGEETLRTWGEGFLVWRNIFRTVLLVRPINKKGGLSHDDSV